MTADTRIEADPPSKHLFSLGRVVATSGAIELMRLTETDPRVLLVRHISGDWGDIHPEDIGVNEEALEHGWRLLSVYRLPLRDPSTPAENLPPIGEATDDCVWLITEADRSVTTILLPEEY